MGDGASHTPLRLVGDIGGTNARFALAESTSGRPRLSSFRSLRCADYPSLEQAIAAYFAGQPSEPRPATAVIAVAGPVVDGALNFTNLGWRVSEAELARTFGFRSATLINDYAALALAAPALNDEDVHHIGPKFVGRADSTIAMIGAGTGFGASALVRDGRAEAVLTTEGGHIAYAPTDALEAEIWRLLSLKFGRVSVERVLSGPGLVNLHNAMLQLEGRKPDGESPELDQPAGRGGRFRWPCAPSSFSATSWARSRATSRSPMAPRADCASPAAWPRDCWAISRRATSAAASRPRAGSRATSGPSRAWS